MLDSKKDQLVTFTEVATKKLQEVMKEQGSENSYLRVSINETPNGGFEYVFGLVEEPEKDDIISDSAIKTVVDPVVIGAAWVGHGEPGSWCVVLLSPCLLIPVPFTVTLELNPSLFGAEQCVTSESTLLPLQIAGTFFLH